MSEPQQTRRELLQKVVYISPMILTLPAVQSFASAGSGRDNQGHHPGRAFATHLKEWAEEWRDKVKDHPAHLQEIADFVKHHKPQH